MQQMMLIPSLAEMPGRYPHSIPLYRQRQRSVHPQAQRGPTAQLLLIYSPLHVDSWPAYDALGVLHFMTLFSGAPPLYLGRDVLVVPKVAPSGILIHPSTCFLHQVVSSNKHGPHHASGAGMSAQAAPQWCFLDGCQQHCQPTLVEELKTTVCVFSTGLPST